MVYGKDGWRMLGVAALGLLLGCFESSVTPTTSGDDSSSGPPGGACVPGETQTCLCVGGAGGVQICNDLGTGYGDCTCVTSMSTSGSSGSATDSPGTTTADTGSSSEGADTVADTSALDTGPPPDADPYGPCDRDGSCPAGEVCVGALAAGVAICATPCVDSAECPELPAELEGASTPECQVMNDGSMACVLPCNDNAECPRDMSCDFGYCIWFLN